MLKHLSLSALLLPVVLHAQPTLQQSMVDPAGVHLTMYLLTSPGSASLPSDGANQTWDLSSVTLQPVGMLHFIPAAGTPFAGSYPGANWAWQQEYTGLGSEFMYLNISSSGIDVMATGVPFDTHVYTDPKRVLNFPFSLGNSLFDNYVDSDGMSSVSWTYSGHGTAITPVGTFTDVAKVVSSDAEIVLWYTQPLHPLMIADGSTIVAFAPSATGITEHRGAQASVYPNPCADQLYVDVHEAMPWQIVDMQGRVVASGAFQGSGTQRIMLNDVAPGAYLLHIQERDGRRAIRFSKD
jgi:hypothetical protein